MRTGAPGDELVLGPGTLAPASTLTVSRNLTIRGVVGNLAAGSRLSGGNITQGDTAGLVVVEPGVTLTVRNLTLTGVGTAGALADVAGALALENATVSGNNGIGIVVQSGGALATLNTTIADNAEFGVIVSPDARAAFRSTTIAGNTLGGLANAPDATVTLTNTIVANPGPQSYGDCQSPVQAATGALSQDPSCGTPLVGDPLLAPLTNNGGPTSTRALGPGSPAIGAGAAGCPAADQRFAPRSIPCDIGAYERDGVPLTAIGTPSRAGGASGGVAPGAGPPARAGASAACPGPAASRRWSGRIGVRTPTVNLAFTVRLGAARSASAARVGPGLRLRWPLRAQIGRTRATLTGPALRSGRRVCVAIAVRRGPRPEVRLATGRYRRSVVLAPADLRWVAGRATRPR